MKGKGKSEFRVLVASLAIATISSLAANGASTTTADEICSGAATDAFKPTLLKT